MIDKIVRTRLNSGLHDHNFNRKSIILFLNIIEMNEMPEESNEKKTVYAY